MPRDKRPKALLKICVVLSVHAGVIGGLKRVSDPLDLESVMDGSKLSNMGAGN